VEIPKNQNQNKYEVLEEEYRGRGTLLKYTDIYCTDKKEDKMKDEDADIIMRLNGRIYLYITQTYVNISCFSPTAVFLWHSVSYNINKLCCFEWIN
jgi:hypothetical protein